MTQQPKPPKGQYSSAPAWDKQMRPYIAVGFGLFLLALVLIFWSVIPLALTTVVIAYLLTPISDGFTRVAFGQRGWGVLLTFIFIFMVIIFVLVMLLPPLIVQSVDGLTSLFDAGVRLIEDPIFIGDENPLIVDPNSGEPISVLNYMRQYASEEGYDTIVDWLTTLPQTLQLDRDTIQQIFFVSSDVTSSVLGSLASIAGTAVGFIFSAIFFITILAMLLSGGRGMMHNVLNIVPEGYNEDANRLLHELAQVWDGYVRGNLTLGFIMGVAMWIFATLLGLPNPLFLAFVAFSMEFIPNIGPTITMAVAAILALAGGSSTLPDVNNLAIAGIVIGVWIVMQQIEAIVLVPRIVGENLKLHPMIVILAVIWGGSFGGLLGVIVAPPLVASTRIIVQYFYGRLTGRPAFAAFSPPPQSIFIRLQRWLSGRQARRKQAQS